ncbi:hypothetical protein FKW77_009442 [Venturia effusa]|uniref:SET domain-containing protein n=1 Tax=Venturia effusa TaxID=50376 RepID=A0A517KXA7_9PEZI|nr:hypothetical protein FKW77_009442 [Venturia effusa]
MEEPWNISQWTPSSPGIFLGEEGPGYPDLCAGDMHRARLLVEAALEKSSELGNEALLVYGLAEWLEDTTWGTKSLETFERHIISSLRKLEEDIWTVIIRVLWDLQALWDGVQLDEMRSKSRQSWFHSFKRGLREKEETMRQHSIGTNAAEVQEALRSGYCLARPYPWMSKAMLRRRDEDVEDCSNLLMEASEGRCKIAKSSLQGPKPDVYGVFATRSLKKGQNVMVLEAAAVALFEEKDKCLNCMKSLDREASRLVCCQERICSRSCADRALTTYHKVLCGKTMNFPQIDLAGDSRLTVMIRLRTLAAIVQADNGVACPLFHPAVNCLTPNNALAPSPWTYHEDIVYPFEMLKQLGINIFADLRYDTWVLRTIFSRIKNNVAGERGQSQSLDPLYFMLNHSCHRNMKAEQIDHTSIRYRATRDIQKGEELFISYIGDVTNMPYEHRQEMLRNWFDGIGGCACARCRIDSKGSVEAKRVYYRQHQQAFA